MGMMDKLKHFARELITELKKDDIIAAANDLTYRIFFSAFPFAIFLMSVAGFIKLDAELLTEWILEALPDVVNEYAKSFIYEIINRRNANLLSFSLIAAVFSASSGFRTAVRSINRAYGLRDSRKFYTKHLISFALVLIFSVIIIFCFALLIFGDMILHFFLRGSYYIIVFNVLRYIISAVILFFSVILTSKIALFKNRKTTLNALSVGALFTSVAWVLVSAIFNIYVDNFANFSALYGSVGAVIVLMLWVNIMCITLLVGVEINAVIEAMAGKRD